MRKNYDFLKLQSSQQIDCLLRKTGDLERSLRAIISVCETGDSGSEADRETIENICSDALSEKFPYDEGSLAYEAIFKAVE